MAQVKVTEYFNSCKRRYDIQPHKRRKICDGYVHLKGDSDPNKKCNLESVEIDHEFVQPKVAPFCASNNKLRQSTSNKTKTRIAINKKKVGTNAKLGIVDIRQAFASVTKPSQDGTRCDPDVNTRAELVATDKTRYLTPKKTHSTASTAECVPPKRRKQNDSQDLSTKNSMHEEFAADQEIRGKISARRSLVMPSDEQISDNSEAFGTGMNTKPTEKSATISDGSTTIENANDKKKLTPGEIKERLEKCGKLGDVKKLLTSLKKTSDKLKSKVEFSSKELIITTKLSKSPEKLHSLIRTDVKVAQTTPAYERYHGLATEGTPSLTLPYKYKMLAEIFRSVDTVISLLHNRQEMCTYSKLKISVQSMMKKAFEKYSLCQIKTVFPLAYFFQQEKCHPNFETRKHKAEPYQLTITPNFDYSDGTEGENAGEPSSTKNKKMPVMNPSCLLERRTIFNKNLLSIVKKHHQAFLETLNIPVAISSDDIQRWHPRFDLNTVPEIEPSVLPEPPGTTYSTAQDVLDRVQNTLGEKIESALKSVAEKKLTNSQPQDGSGSSVQTNNTTGALKGISQSLIEKIRAKEAKRIAKDMTRKPEDEKKLEMISRLPELIRILRTYFITERKAAISVEHAKLKLSESYHSHLSPEEVEQHISLLSDLLPDWLSLITIRKGVFLKIDKNKEVSLLLDTLETERKRITDVN